MTNAHKIMLLQQRHVMEQEKDARIAALESKVAALEKQLDERRKLYLTATEERDAARREGEEYEAAIRYMTHSTEPGDFYIIRREAWNNMIVGGPLLEAVRRAHARATGRKEEP